MVEFPREGNKMLINIHWQKWRNKLKDCSTWRSQAQGKLQTQIQIQEAGYYKMKMQK
jgi:hypothetical protein